VVLKFYFTLVELEIVLPRRVVFETKLPLLLLLFLQKGFVRDIASQPVMVIPLSLTRSITTPGCQAIFHEALVGPSEMYALRCAARSKIGDVVLNFCTVFMELKVSPPPSLIIWLKVDLRQFGEPF
jgi:hypothetical protein